MTIKRTVPWRHQEVGINPPKVAAPPASAVPKETRCGWCFKDRVIDGHCRACGSKMNPGGGSWQVPDVSEKCRERLMGVSDREALAWSLFVTDRAVHAFVIEVADAWSPPEGSDGVTFRVQHQAPIDRAYATAWRRDERGWKTSMRERAEEMLRVMAGGPCPPHPTGKP